MSRGRRFTSLESDEKALKDGASIGSGENYQPWIRPQDFTQSTGIRSAICGLKTFRQHNTLSGIESEFYYLAEFNDAVIDIREQFPLLPITLTQNIARILNVPHPTLRRNVKGTDIPATPAVMTTDFVLTFRNPDGSIKYRAYSVKPDEIISRRDTEKQEIERLFWEGIDVQLQVYTGSKINKIKIDNINWFTAPFRMNGLPDLNIDLSILRMLPPGQYMISDFVKKLTLSLRIFPERSLYILKFMLATNSIEVDLTSDIVNCGYISVSGVYCFRKGTSRCIFCYLQCLLAQHDLIAEHILSEISPDAIEKRMELKAKIAALYKFVIKSNLVCVPIQNCSVA